MRLEGDVRFGRILLKLMTLMTKGEIFFAEQADFLQEYRPYFKKKRRGYAEKEPPFGRAAIFQTNSNLSNNKRRQTQKSVGVNYFGSCGAILRDMSKRNCDFSDKDITLFMSGFSFSLPCLP